LFSPVGQANIREGGESRPVTLRDQVYCYTREAWQMSTARARQAIDLSLGRGESGKGEGGKIWPSQMPPSEGNPGSTCL